MVDLLSLPNMYRKCLHQVHAQVLDKEHGGGGGLLQESLNERGPNLVKGARKG